MGAVGGRAVDLRAFGLSAEDAMSASLWLWYGCGLQRDVCEWTMLPVAGGLHFKHACVDAAFGHELLVIAFFDELATG